VPKIKLKNNSDIVPQNRYTYREVYDATLKYFKGDELATGTWISKYCLKDGEAIDDYSRSLPLEIQNDPAKMSDALMDAPVYAELTPDHMHKRLAREIARANAKYDYKNVVNPHFKLDQKDFEQVLYNSFKDFAYVVPQGSPMYGIGNPFVRVSISNCVVVRSPEDDLTDILGATSADLGNLWKRRCGIGIDLSTLRPEGAAVNNSAQSSTGAWSFAEHYSNICRMVGQSGRRGATMLTLDVRHPDIERFVKMKRDLTKVTGANISVLLTDEFMKAVENDEDWVTRYPIEARVDREYTEDEGEWVERVSIDPDSVALQTENVFVNYKPKYTKRMKARDLWYTINESAVMCAEPGLIFWDTYRSNLPADYYPGFQCVSTNPCSEIALSPYDSCRLTSLNLKSFVKNPHTKDAYFDFEEYDYQVRLGQRVMDAVVDLEIEYLQNVVDSIDNPDEIRLWKKLIAAAHLGRRTGLGDHAVGDLLVTLGIKYDSEEAIEVIDKVYEAFRNAAYDESVNMAIERGAFPMYDHETEKECPFIQRLPEWLQEKMRLHGRRNISVLTMAPTGSVSIVSQTSSGIEPIFRFAYIRRKKINALDFAARVDFVDQNGDKWQHFPVMHHSLREFIAVNEEYQAKWRQLENMLNSEKWSDEFGKKFASELENFEKSLPPQFVNADSIDPKFRVRLQGVLQSYIDHGVSSTINMPRGTTVEQGQELYELAWKCGLKGVTIYVDGSRSGVLVEAGDARGGKPEGIVEHAAPDRPDELPCEIIRANVDGKGWIILIGTFNGKPYEVFGGLSDYIVLPRKYKAGRIRKREITEAEKNRTPLRRNSAYDLLLGEGDDELVVKDVVSAFNDGDYAYWTRALSAMLRYGVPIETVIDSVLAKDPSADLFSFTKVMSRTLKKHAVKEDGTPVYTDDMLAQECASGRCS
jgi:ribonucleoside-diphosphate reductase alpha chain